jgi:DNA-binding YbaB/EbfC family protein
MSEPLDLQAMLSQAQELQQRMLEAQEAAAGQTVEGTAGGGVVRITASGVGEFLAVHIDPNVVDAADVEMLEDLVLAALHDVAAKVADVSLGRLGELGPLGDIGRDLGLGSPSDQGGAHDSGSSPGGTASAGR